MHVLLLIRLLSICNMVSVDQCSSFEAKQQQCDAKRERATSGVRASDSMSEGPVRLISLKSRVYVLKDRNPVGPSASRSVGS